MTQQLSRIITSHRLHMKKSSIIPSIIAILFLFGALGKWPYGYYTLLRFAVCGAAIYIALSAYTEKTMWGAWVFGIIALLFNPIVKVHLDKDTWVAVDIGTAVLFIVWTIKTHITKINIHNKIEHGLQSVASVTDGFGEMFVSLLKMVCKFIILPTTIFIALVICVVFTRAYIKEYNHNQSINNKKSAYSALINHVHNNPNSEEAHYNLANYYYENGDWILAVEEFKRSSSINDKNELAYSGLGKSYAQIGEYDNSIDAFKKAIALKPDYLELYRNLGSVYFAMGRMNDAIMVYEKVIKLSPNDVDAYYMLGKCHYHDGNKKQFLRVYENLKYINEDKAEELIKSYKWN